MIYTIYRDQVAQLAKTDPLKGIEIAKNIGDPWFQAQAWSWLARFAEDNPLPLAQKASKSAALCKDDYQRSAVRAWEIAALAERNYLAQARLSLEDAVKTARSAEPIGSRAEALLLLFQAAFIISSEEARQVAEVLQGSCSATHWRAKRALRDAGRMLNGEVCPRSFFW